MSDDFTTGGGFNDDMLSSGVLNELSSFVLDRLSSDEDHPASKLQNDDGGTGVNPLYPAVGAVQPQQQSYHHEQSYHLQPAAAHHHPNHTNHPASSKLQNDDGGTGVNPLYPAVGAVQPQQQSFHHEQSYHLQPAAAHHHPNHTNHPASSILQHDPAPTQQHPLFP